jgi:hypothetical protein
MTFRMHRRSFLRGAGGVAVGLPVLECMLNGNGTAFAGGSSLPKRYAILFAGQSIGGDNWAKNASRIAGQNVTEDGHFIAPLEEGPGYTLTTPLLPLAGLEDDFSVVSNMRIPYDGTADPSNIDMIPPGGAFRGFHGGVKSPLLSGVRSTSSSYSANGITSDQVIANMHGGESMVFRAQPSFYLAGYSFAGRQNISYSGPNTPVEAQHSPQNAFMSLFGNFTPDNEADLAILDFTLRSRRSVLDLITSKRQRVLGQVGSADRIRLERHYDELRDLEMRISAIDPGDGACQKLDDPGADPSVGGDNAGAGSGSIETNTGWSDETLRTQTFADIIHMAFVCDLFRAASLQITAFQSHMNVHVPTSDLGIPMLADLHEIGHNGDTENRGQIAVSTCLQWHVDLYAHLVRKLKDTDEGAGSVLDNCAIIFTPEGGHGTQLDDGSSQNQAHSVEEMCMLIAGRAGGLTPGKHVRTANVHPARVLISGMRGVGYEEDTLGEVSGVIPELFA